MSQDKPKPYILSEEERHLMKDKVTETPGTLPYAHHSGSAIIKPIDKGRVKGVAVQAMHEQTEAQLKQIYEQVELLKKKAQGIQDRVEISERIYQAGFKSKPVIGKMYHLYEKENGEYSVSFIGPNEWGRSFPFKKHLATMKLLADHTWDVSDNNLDN